MCQPRRNDLDTLRGFYKNSLYNAKATARFLRSKYVETLEDGEWLKSPKQ